MPIFVVAGAALGGGLAVTAMRMRRLRWKETPETSRKGLMSLSASWASLKTLSKETWQLTGRIGTYCCSTTPPASDVAQESQPPAYKNNDIETTDLFDEDKHPHEREISHGADSGDSDITQTPITPNHRGGGSDLEFELMVETNLEADWCLKDNSKEGDSQDSWRESCHTSTIKRNWDDFEAMGQQRAAAAVTRAAEAPHAAKARRAVVDPKAIEASLQVLGLHTGASQDQVRAAFHQKCLTCHPDKGGSSVEFDQLLRAYQTLSSR